LIDALYPVCTPVDQRHLMARYADEIMPVATELDVVGHSGGGHPFERLCQKGMHLVGLKGTSGSLVDSIQPFCVDTAAMVTTLTMSDAAPSGEADDETPVEPLPDGEQSADVA